MIIFRKIKTTAVCEKVLENPHGRFVNYRSHIVLVQLGWSHVRKWKP